MLINGQYYSLHYQVTFMVLYKKVKVKGQVVIQGHPGFVKADLRFDILVDFIVDINKSFLFSRNISRRH